MKLRYLPYAADQETENVRDEIAPEAPPALA